MMMRSMVRISLLLLVLVACAKDEGKKTVDEVKSPSATPAATSLFTSFDGPLLNPISNTGAEDCSLNPEAGSDCTVPVGAVDGNALPLALKTESILEVDLGIPEGFEVLMMGERASIEAIHTDTHTGDFRVFIQWLDGAGVEKLLNSYSGLDMTQKADIHSGDWTGYAIPNGNRGMVAVWLLDEDRQFVLEGFASPGYWPQYAATFNKMLSTIAFETDARTLFQPG